MVGLIVITFLFLLSFLLDSIYMWIWGIDCGWIVLMIYRSVSFIGAGMVSWMDCFGDARREFDVVVISSQTFFWWLIFLFFSLQKLFDNRHPEKNSWGLLWVQCVRSDECHRYWWQDHHQGKTQFLGWIFPQGLRFYFIFSPYFSIGTPQSHKGNSWSCFQGLGACRKIAWNKKAKFVVIFNC